MQRKGKAVLGTVEVPFDTLVKYRSMLVETANNIEAFVKKQLNPLLGTEKLMDEISTDEKEEEEDPDAIYNADEDGFVCNYKGCSESIIYEVYDIVEHIQKKHGVEPDDQYIEGWTDEHEKAWKKELKKKARKKIREHKKTKTKETLGYSEEDLEDMSMGELWALANKFGISKKGKKGILIKRILKAQQKGGQEKPIKRIPLTELQRIAPPSYYATTRRVTQCPKDCPNLAKQNKCTIETCIYEGRSRPTFKEVYLVARKSV